jgi:GT2 family glycosyltransferase
MMQDKLTVLIPTRNRADDLRQALEHMNACGLGNLRYIIYDDASDQPDATEATATQSIAHVRLLRGKKRLGQAGGRNALLRACTTPYALFMDDDTWFTELGDISGILARDFEYEGIGKASAVCAQVFRTSDGETLFPNQLNTCRIINPLGMGCIVRVEDILKVGAFREYWRYRHEETELGLRLWKHQMPVVYDASLLVEHCHTSAARSSNEYDRNSSRNLILMHALNLPGFSGLPLGFLRAMRLLLNNEYSKRSILVGAGEGLWDTARHWSDIKPMSYAQHKRFCEFRKDLQRACGSHTV